MEYCLCFFKNKIFFKDFFLLIKFLCGLIFKLSVNVKLFLFQLASSNFFYVEMTSKQSKSVSAKNKSGASAGSDLRRPLVPPVLREVGKLAAGVASVSTNSAGSATG